VPFHKVKLCHLKSPSLIENKRLVVTLSLQITVITLTWSFTMHANKLMLKLSCLLIG